MDKRIRIGGIIGALIFSALVLTSPSSDDPTDTLWSTQIPIPEPFTDEQPNEFVEIVATNLEKPWAIDFADDRIFISERSGKIQIIQSGQLLDEPLISLRVADVFGGGLLGIVTHPHFSDNHLLYAYYTYEDDGKLWNKIIQVKEMNNEIIDITTILDKIPGSSFSNGGVMKFGPDDKLYVGTGSVSDSSHEPQDLNSLAGKILRLDDDGSIPNDNPFENSFVYTYGHRNLTGLAWDSFGKMYATESGPTKNDEINLIKAGSNYGWPDVQCFSDNEDFENPVKCFDPAIEPGGIIFYSGDKFELENNMILASQKSRILFKVTINENDTDLDAFMSGIGRIRDVAQSEDGYIYIITSNTDGKAITVYDNDDKLLRILK